MSVTTSRTSEPHQALAKTASSYPADRFSPQAFVAAVATRAAALEISDQELMIFLRRQVATRQGLSKFLGQHTPRKRVFAAAKRAAVSSSPAGAAASARKVSRLAVGRLLSKIEGDTTSPEGLKDEAEMSDEEWAAAMLEVGEQVEVKAPSPARQLRARVALAVATTELLASIQGPQGWNTIQLSYARLALTTGWSQSTAKAALTDLVAWSLISEIESGRKATARRFKMNRGLGAAGRETAKSQFETIGALMGRAGAESGAADLIKLVGHSAWNYGPNALGHRAWLVSVADAGSVDLLTLSVSKRNISLDRKALLAAGISADIKTEDLVTALDAFSRESGGLEAHREAEEAYRVAADERAEEVKFHQDLKGDAREVVAELVGTWDSIPKPGVAGGRKLARWIEVSREALTGRSYPADLATAVTNEVGKIVGSRIRDVAAGKLVGGWITAGLTVDGEIPAKRVIAMKAARGLELFAPLMNIPGAKSDEIDQKRFLKELQTQLNGLPAMSTNMQQAITADLRARLVVRLWGADKSAKGSAWAVRDVAITPATTQAA